MIRGLAEGHRGSPQAATFGTPNEVRHQKVEGFLSGYPSLHRCPTIAPPQRRKARLGDLEAHDCRTMVERADRPAQSK